MNTKTNQTRYRTKIKNEYETIPSFKNDFNKNLKKNQPTASKKQHYQKNHHCACVYES